MIDTGFDYQVVARCQYGLLDEYNLEHDCGEPAAYKVWWHPAIEHILFMCTEHFDEIAKDEEAEERQG